MNYSEKVSEVWRHVEPDNGVRDYRELVRYATLAASSHNTQPWKFKLEPNRILILPDLSRRCPAVDPDDHHLYASLGCAAENILVAAPAFGLKGNYSYDSNASTVQIDFEETPPLRSSLFEAIPKRQCSRVEFDGSSLSIEQTRKLEEAAHGTGVSVMFITDN